MFEVPFFSNFVEKAVKRHQVDDTVDYLNYYVTTILIGIFAVATSAKQYFGSPIKCWVPAEFEGGWESYAEDYCFISSSYHLPFEEEIQHTRENADHYSYYRWVPIALAIQAICFFLPNFVWNQLHKRTRINPASFLKEAEKMTTLTGSKRDEEVGKLAVFFMETVSVFGSAEYPMKFLKTPHTGRNAMLLYLFTKGLYIFNIYAQIVMLDNFLGENYLDWGLTSVANFFDGSEWEDAPVFPRVILCDFQIRRLGNLHTNTVQCVIMMNMINEKIYLFLFLWFMLLAVINLVNFFYYLAILLLPGVRINLVTYKVDDRRRKPFGFGRPPITRFVNECLHPDGVLLLQFVSEHVGGRVSYDLASKLLAMYNDHESSFDSSSTKSSTLSPPSILLRYESPPGNKNSMNDLNSNNSVTKLPPS